MNRDMIQDRLGELETFRAWQAAQAEQDAAAAARPTELNVRSKEHLNLQMSYLDAELGQLAARATLMEEVAEQGDEFLSVPYRLGVLAAFRVAEPGIPDLLPSRGRLAHGRASSVYVDRSEQPVYPADSPVLRAAQIGDEIIRIQQSLDSQGPVPVAMVWHHRGEQFEEHSEVAVGDIADPSRAFTLTPPRVSISNGERDVQSTVPIRLHGVEKREAIGDIRYRRSDEVYETPVIPTLRKLLNREPADDEPEALYIGNEAVGKRVERARSEVAVERDGRRLRAERARRHRRRPHRLI